jgi:regulator of sigma E protease
MNPFEEHDEDDKGSYANASLLGRITTIFGGPLANYLFASVFFFFSLYHGGVRVDADPKAEGTTVVTVFDDTPADESGIKDGDRIVEVMGKPVNTWEQLRDAVSVHPEEAIDITVEREGAKVSVNVTPEKAESDPKRGVIGVGLLEEKRPVTAGEAAKLAVTRPPLVVRNLVVGIYDMIRGKVKPKLGGPVKIVQTSARAARRGIADWLELLGFLSAYLGAFNLIPFPALDGGRLMFLGYELATRRRPDARMEAHIHVVGLMMLLGLMLYVTIFNDFKLGK